MLVRRPVWQAAAAGAAVALLLAATSGRAACPDDAAVQAMAAQILVARPADVPEISTLEDGLCAQDKLVAILSEQWGAPIGHKAGLTSKAAQQMFAVTEPVRGVLLADMMLENGAHVPADFGALPRFEADLIVAVGDAAINDAATPAEVLAHLRAVYPFIELPDLVVADPATLNGPTITAINVGARLGILGAAIPAEATTAFLDMLADMIVTVTDQNGGVLASAPGSAVLDHPLNAVLWLMESGVTLAPGDLVSVGSIGPLLAPSPGLTATVSYAGLPGEPALTVTFE